VISRFLSMNGVGALIELSVLEKRMIQCK